MTATEELASLRAKLAASQGMEGYADRRKALEKRIKEIEDDSKA